MTKLWVRACEALRDVVRDGITVAVGGFGLSGNPFGLIDALRETGAKDLVVVSNNMGPDRLGLGILLESRQVRKVIASYIGENRLFARQYLDGWAGKATAGWAGEKSPWCYLDRQPGRPWRRGRGAWTRS